MIRFEAALSDLTGALVLVAPAMSPASPDLMGHFVFRRVSNTTMDVLTHESYAQAKASFVASVTLDGDDDVDRFTVPGKGLMTLLDVCKDENPDDVIVITFDQGAVTVVPKSAPGRKTSFETRDPAYYKYFDDQLDQSTLTGVILADRLKAALTAAKAFISTDDTGKPQITCTELRADDTGAVVLLASAGKTMFKATLDGQAPTAFLRVQVKQHWAPVLAFLSASKGLPIELRYLKDRMFFLCQEGTGNVLGFTCYGHEFPAIKSPPDGDAEVWSIPTRALRNGIKAVMSSSYLTGSKDTVNPILFTRSQAGLKASTLNNPNGEWSLPLSVSRPAQSDGLPLDFKFAVTPETLSAILGGIDGDTVSLGLNVTSSGLGFLRVVETREFEALAPREEDITDGDDAKAAAPNRDVYWMMASWYRI